MIIFFLFYAQAAYFFKETTSSFPSGYAPSKQLEESVKQRKSEVWYRVSHGSKYYWVLASSVIHQKDLAGHVILERQEDLFLAPNTKVVSKISGGKYASCNRSNSWVEICGKGWVNSPFLQWDYSLIGSHAVTLRSGNIFHKADLLYPLQMFPENFRVKIIKEEKDFYLVRAFSRNAYIKKDDVLTLTSFKTGNVYLPDLATTAKPSIDEALQENIKGEIYVSQVEERSIEWMQSVVKGHGFVWWKEEGKKIAKESPLFNIKDIMSKKVFDIAKHPQKNLTVVSAGGVYRSFDGLNWEKLEKFQDKNFALAFSPNGELYVGDTRSDDLGEKFERFVRWDQIMRELNIRADSQDFLIQEISFKQNDIILHVKKQKTDFYVTSKDQGRTWQRYKKPEESFIDSL